MEDLQPNKDENRPENNEKNDLQNNDKTLEQKTKNKANDITQVGFSELSMYRKLTSVSYVIQMCNTQ